MKHIYYLSMANLKMTKFDKIYQNKEQEGEIAKYTYKKEYTCIEKYKDE